ncbi:MAG: hypothetical protein ABF969_04120 [Sporolactobacillus sp.]
MNDPETFKLPCAICHKRPATRYCDYIIGYSNPQMFMIDYQQICGNNGPHYETCDVPMCDECAKNIDREIDFCPYHYDLYQKAKKLPQELKNAQARVKRKIDQESLF